MSYLPGDYSSKKGKTIRQFCREEKLDYPVIHRICDLLNIGRNSDELYIIDSFDEVKITDYIKTKSTDPQINIYNDSISVRCLNCDRKVHYKSVIINRMTTQWVICDCGKKINVTARMIIIDKS